MIRLKRTIAFLRAQGATRIAFCTYGLPPIPLMPALTVGGFGGIAVIDARAGRGILPRRMGRLPVITIDEASELEGIDAVIVLDRDWFPLIMRAIEPLMRRDIIVIPADPAWIVSRQMRNLSSDKAAWTTGTDVNYVARSGLRGHYLEFGTFWGRSFFPAFYRHRHWLQGRFYAFDSFAGLSTPASEETEFTAGDFRKGTYHCNLRSFNALSRFVDMPPERLVIIPGFYDQVIANKDPSAYGITPESVSVCSIDCDLFEPTRLALDFVLPALEPGALLYFDDWRLCRASPKTGERAAALDWLERNPSIELIELHRETWQHQWFIFQRR